MAPVRRSPRFSGSDTHSIARKVSSLPLKNVQRIEPRKPRRLVEQVTVFEHTRHFAGVWAARRKFCTIHENIDRPAQDSAQATSQNSFPQFSKLPLELQDYIWSFAVVLLPQASPRIIRVAPDPNCWFWRGHRLEYNALSKFLTCPVLKLLPGSLASVPSLLHVCQRSRAAALKTYTLWEIESPGNYVMKKRQSLSRKRTRVIKGNEKYINKSFDTFYFMGDHFLFLDLLRDTQERAQEGRRLEEYLKFDVPTLHRYLDQLRGVRHIALTLGIWGQIAGLDERIEWLRHLPDLTDITVVLTTENLQAYAYGTSLATSPKLVPIRPGTLRAKVQGLVLSWIQDRFQRFRSEFHSQVLPKAHVKTLDSSDDNQDSIHDRNLFERLKKILD